MSTTSDEISPTSEPSEASVPVGPIRLTQLSHGGGCGCKIAPGVLEQILARVSPGLVPPQLLVGRDTRDDAAVYQINDEQAIVATTDFFMPIVDDPFDFGRIAATNAISDIYAMGGTPLFALAIVGMPVNTLPLETIGRILEGGESVCAKARIPIAGGHSIDSVEPIYGLVVIGLVHPGNIRRNSGAQVGDKLILGKRLGIGLYSAAFKKGMLSPHDYELMIELTTKLNTPGPMLACLAGVHAMTDVTGFGLLGHLLEVCNGSGVSARLDYSAIPVLPRAGDLADRGCVTGASARNWAACGDSVELDSKRFGNSERALLTDPQTSGGLLISCAPEVVTQVLAVFLQQSFDHAAVIGEIVEGKPGIRFI
ncbi:selenophosphate synthase [Candidatus Propionivibrio aalborgensis]|uniref:Selenide, water dikinase n=1 Tax=Candidatus Propionivibrio aalborgensis TaxID=1860101 RepID=A0A1A8Y289_9RHOO|nr:selenide, water dikinase SelD [Candidatus Propionivibrio aalborgensis]MBK7325145.1 selenide, water dikinase SelD [Propionivibrio sp.]MBK7563247.1 selenide, water dikinase SelD [Propionivibrio sp.]MBK9026400.1 selenide, water dikinase SelD [Propionivibrio sp.]SBT11249.1 selenophosphate synthase [Candidatus Propionivibrio aalborgensis]